MASASKFKRLATSTLKEDSKPTGKDIGRLFFAELCERSSWYESRYIRSTTPFPHWTIEDIENANKAELLAQGLQTSRQTARRSVDVAYTSMRAAQIELKEIAATYRNITTENQAAAYKILHCVGVKKYSEQFDNDSIEFKFSANTLMMLSNIVTGMFRSLHFNAMIKEFSLWAEYRDIRNLAVMDMSLHLYIFNQLIAAVRDDIKNSALSDDDKTEAVKLFDKCFPTIDIKMLRPSRAYRARVRTILDNKEKERRLFYDLFQVDLSAMSGEERQWLDENSFFCCTPTIITKSDGSRIAR